ncbi:MAG: hypothetical protein EBR82_26625 [Caulobacteraceae bacterium]|nr:hypothetical protein [Caulobacteraceae bacterium]
MMSKAYYALITLNTDNIEADSVAEVNAKINDLIDQLGSVNTEVSWDNVDWVILEDSPTQTY